LKARHNSQTERKAILLALARAVGTYNSFDYL